MGSRGVTTLPAEVEPFLRAQDNPGLTRKPDCRGGARPGMGTRASCGELHTDSRSIGDTAQRRRGQQGARSPAAGAGAQGAERVRPAGLARERGGGGSHRPEMRAHLPRPASRGRGTRRPRPRASPEAGQLRPGARPRQLNGQAGRSPRKLPGTPGLRARRAAAVKHR